MLYNIDVNDENRFRTSGVQGPDNGWNYPDGLFIGLQNYSALHDVYLRALKNKIGLV